MKLLTAQQTKNAEQTAFKRGMSAERLMENAGSAATRVIKKNFEPKGLKVVVVAGQGNNGGDGFVVARKLKEYGAYVTIMLVMGLPATKQSSVTLSSAKATGVSVVNYYDNVSLCEDMLLSADLVVDAIFGIGFHGIADREISHIISFINTSPAKKVALDIPSGLTADSGEVSGVAVRADVTVSFIGYKPCRFIYPAAEYCGHTIAVSIGIDDELIDDFLGEIFTVAEALSVLPTIPSNAHKGTKGTVGIIGGCYGMAGAPIIAARSAMRSGAGLVRLILPERIYPIAATALPEAVFTPLKDASSGDLPMAVSGDLFKNLNALVIGMGMGQSDDAVATVARVLSFAKVPMVIDADGLNALAADNSIFDSINSPAVITPHPGEMAGLTGLSVETINKNKIKIARDFAFKNGVITVLKGAYTVIAAPDGRLCINTTGNEGMATAGCGDMLAGMIGAFMAAGMEPFKAAAAAVCLHGAAGDAVKAKIGVRGMLTSDMVEALPEVLNANYGG